MLQTRFFFLILLSLLACGSPVIASPSSLGSLPTLTPTALFPRWEATYVMRAIRRAGLVCEDIHLMAPEEYGALPSLASQGVRFSTPSLCPECGGMVLSFDRVNTLEATKLYYLNASAPGEPGASSWVFVKDNVLVQLSGEIPRAQAIRYGSVLVHLK